MLESLWTSETKHDLEKQAAQEPEPKSEIGQEAKNHTALIAEDEPLPEEHEEVAPPVALAVSADDFSALEDRILRAVEMLKHERQARASAEVRVAEAEVRVAEAEELARQAVERLGPLQMRLEQQTPGIESLQNEIFSLRAERDTVRLRVERLLEQLDSLEI